LDGSPAWRAEWTRRSSEPIRPPGMSRLSSALTNTTLYDCKYVTVTELVSRVGEAEPTAPTRR
jgi:hypothetical protein